MIIDIHTHYGVILGKYNMSIEMQLEAMKKYHIDYALISNIECACLNACIEGNRKMIDIVRMHRDMLGCMLWGCESLDDKQKITFEELYLENKDIVKGIKLHPDISGIPADDICFDFFYEMGAKYHLPVLLHTKQNEFSSVDIVINAAKRHPDTIFILGHLEICSDGKAALEAIKKYDNVYGDTAWVNLEVVKEAEKMGIVHKLMFGTDSPISGAECYGDAYYKGYYTDTADYMQSVMSENAAKLFDL